MVDEIIHRGKLISALAEFRSCHSSACSPVALRVKAQVFTVTYNAFQGDLTSCFLSDLYEPNTGQAPSYRPSSQPFAGSPFSSNIA